MTPDDITFIESVLGISLGTFLLIFGIILTVLLGKYEVEGEICFNRLLIGVIGCL